MQPRRSVQDRVREGVEQWREAGITTPVLVPLSPDGSQMNGLKGSSPPSPPDRARRRCRSGRTPIRSKSSNAYSTDLLNALINLAIKDAIAREESSCRKCFPWTAS